MINLKLLALVNRQFTSVFESELNKTKYGAGNDEQTVIRAFGLAAEAITLEEEESKK